MTHEPLPVAGAAETRRAVTGLLATSKGRTAIAVLTAVAATAAGLAIPAILGHIVDLVVDGRPPSAITGPALLLVAATLANAVLTGLARALLAALGEGALADLRERVVTSALRLSLARVERAGTGDLVSRIGDDVATVAEAIRFAIPAVFVSSLTIALTVVGLGALDWRLALAGVCAAPIQLWALRRYLASAAPLYTAERAAVGARSQQILGSVDGRRTVRAFRLGPDHLDRIEARSRDAVDYSLQAVRLRTRFFSRLNGAELLGLSAVLVTGFALVRAGEAGVGEATAAALYFVRLFDPVMLLLALVDDAQSAAASLARLVGVAGLRPPAAPARPAAPRAGAPAVEVEGVRHAYVEGHDVLRGVDLTIARGERVALVGVSGAGKTTLAKLVAGLQPPGAGEIRLGGASLAELGPAATRRAVALVTQEVHVFAGTLADDLRLARPEASDGELGAALERVGALGWTRALPDGLGTPVGDGGHRVTATQAQQLALARLVLCGTPVAILDEATAEAGSSGARELEAAADRALEGRAALVVAHRLTQAAAADRIVVLDAGGVVEAGAHDELVGAGGRYAALWAAWSAARPG